MIRTTLVVQGSKWQISDCHHPSVTWAARTVCMHPVVYRAGAVSGQVQLRNESRKRSEISAAVNHVPVAVYFTIAT